MKYKDKLQKSLNDDKNVAVEFLLVWLCIAVTSLVILCIIGMAAQ